MEIKFTNDTAENITKFIDIELGLCHDFTPEEKQKDLYTAMIIFGMGAFSQYNEDLSEKLKDKLAEVLKFLSDNDLIQTTGEE